MKNQELAKIFYEIALFLEMEEIAFKPQAYEKAALNIESLMEDVEKIYKKGGKEALKKIPGIGENIAQKIIEYLKTGKIKYLQNFKKKYPIDLQGLTSVEGVGPKIAIDLYKHLRIKNLKDLERAARAGKIRKLRDFGKTSEKNILQGIEFLKRTKGKFLLGEILPKVKEIEESFRSLKEVEQLSVCGSVRRMKETIGDIDFLAKVRSAYVKKGGARKIMDFFCSQKEVLKILGKGETKSSIRLSKGFDVDLRVVPKKSFGAALQYFTGSKEHNIHLRKIAQEKGFKINEYGIFKGSKMVGGKTEQEIYKILRMKCPPPELREDRGEIEAALRQAQGKPNGLPKLVELKDIKGDLHCHSSWDGGKNSILKMAEVARELGYEYIGISDHTKFLRIEHGLNERQLAQQGKEIDELNSRLRQLGLHSRSYFGEGGGYGGQAKFKILHGAETNIMTDGSIDIKDEALKKLDYALAGVHSSLKMPKDKMTQRIIKAMRNPYIKIISHPTGRILNKRDEYKIDFDKILRAARETKTILEINSFPQRLDLNDINIKRAKEAGVKLIINTDSHHKDHLKDIEFGVAQARRGWAEKKDIINTYSINKLLKFFKN